MGRTRGIKMAQRSDKIRKFNKDEPSKYLSNLGFIYGLNNHTTVVKKKIFMYAFKIPYAGL